MVCVVVFDVADNVVPRFSDNTVTTECDRNDRSKAAERNSNCSAAVSETIMAVNGYNNDGSDVGLIE